MRFGLFSEPMKALGGDLFGACRDLSPIILVIALFQILLLRQPFPELLSVLGGLLLVIVGLACFLGAWTWRSFHWAGPWPSN